LTEWKITAGIWAFGILVLTVLIKLIDAVHSNRLHVTEVRQDENP
jgi:hypothetical protein